MHCLPAYRGFEVAAEVIDGPQPVVFQQGHNRLHAARGAARLFLDRVVRPMTSAKAAAASRRSRRLIGQHAVTNQPQLVELLADEGIAATQATVSRDLEDLGAVKVRVPGGETVYAIPEYEPERASRPTTSCGG